MRDGAKTRFRTDDLRIVAEKIVRFVERRRARERRAAGDAGDEDRPADDPSPRALH